MEVSKVSELRVHYDPNAQKLEKMGPKKGNHLSMQNMQKKVENAKTILPDCTSWAFLQKIEKGKIRKGELLKISTKGVQALLQGKRDNMKALFSTSYGMHLT